MVKSESQRSEATARAMLATLIFSELAEFEDDSAVSLAEIVTLYFVFWEIVIATTRHSDASETRLKRCIEITDWM